MKYVVFTFAGYGLPIAWKLQQEGRDVLVAQVQDQKDTLTDDESEVVLEQEEERERRLSLYDGLLEKCAIEEVISKLIRAKDPQEFFVFFDLNHLFRYSERIRDLGFRGN